MTVDEVGGMCDFCGKQEVSWIYPAEDFSIDHMNWASEGGWAACGDCSELIEDGEYKGLIDRAMVSHGGAPNVIKVALREHLAELHEMFRINRTGDRQVLST